MISKKRGAILLYILGVIALLSVIVTEFLMNVSTTIRYRSQMAGREDLEIIAYSALDTSLAVLGEIKAIDKGLYSPVQGWGDPLKYAELPLPSGYTVKITIKDETGKLSIYDEKLNDFENLLTEMGISYEQIVNLKSGLKEYLAKFQEQQTQSPEGQRSNVPGEGRGTEAGQQASQSTAPRSNPATGNQTDSGERQISVRRQDRNGQRSTRTLFSLNQLKEIPIFEKVFFDSKGNPNKKFSILKENVSIFNTGKVNINTAPALIKKMFLGNMSLGPIAEGKKFLTSMADLGRSSNDSQFGFKANVFDVEIEVMRGPVKYYLSALVEDKNATAAPSRDGTRNQSNGSAAPSGSGTRNQPNDLRTPSANDSQNKTSFSFLALTENGSSIN